MASPTLDASTVGIVDAPATERPVAPETDQEESAAAVPSAKSISKITSNMQSSTFHTPALVGRPNAGKASLRQRPVLECTDPKDRKRFTLTMYVMLSGQVAIVALTSSAVTAAILSPGWLPNEIGPSDTYWMPGYPVNVLMLLLPVWLCTMLSFVGLSCARGGIPKGDSRIRRLLLVVTTLATGVSVGLVTYLESVFATLFISIVLMSLVLHTLGIGVNFVSSVATLFKPMKPKASKMEIMARTSCLTGTEKFICLLNDEEAAYTRASFALAGLSWTVATIIAAFVVFAHDITWLPFVFAAVAAGAPLVYFTYGVEKQVRRCTPEEREKAMVNLSVDFLFFVAGCIAVDLSVIRWQELGTAKPCSVEKGMSQFVMKQMSSTTTQSTAVSSSASRTTKTISEQRTERVTVAV